MKKTGHEKSRDTVPLICLDTHELSLDSDVECRRFANFSAAVYPNIYASLLCPFFFNILKAPSVPIKKYIFINDFRSFPNVLVSKTPNCILTKGFSHN
jgi:hypothetical protein